MGLILNNETVGGLVINNEKVGGFYLNGEKAFTSAVPEVVDVTWNLDLEVAIATGINGVLEGTITGSTWATEQQRAANSWTDVLFVDIFRANGALDPISPVHIVLDVENSTPTFRRYDVTVSASAANLMSGDAVSVDIVWYDAAGSRHQTFDYIQVP